MIERDSARTSQEESLPDGDDIRHAGPDPRQDPIRGGRPVADGRGRDARGDGLCGKLGLIGALDAGIGPVKQRQRGFTGGQVLAGMAAAQLAGEDLLVGLDRPRADAAGRRLTPVPGLATSTATGIARRFTAGHSRGVEAGLAAVTAQMAGLLPGERAAELAEGPVTIDIDATDVEVYGSRKRGVAYTYHGQRAGRPHVAAWAETEIPLAADLLAGDDDPRSSAVALLGRALAALPQAVRMGRRRPGGRSRCARTPGTSPGTWPAPPPPWARTSRSARQADHQHVEGAGRDRRGRRAGEEARLSSGTALDQKASAATEFRAEPRKIKIIQPQRPWCVPRDCPSSPRWTKPASRQQPGLQT